MIEIQMILDTVQELNEYMVRPDGTRFTHYDLDGLDDYWAHRNT